MRIFVDQTQQIVEAARRSEITYIPVFLPPTLVIWFLSPGGGIVSDKANPSIIWRTKLGALVRIADYVFAERPS
jgi:hypothetical protein